MNNELGCMFSSWPDLKYFSGYWLH